jgi:hypothetical protein
VILIWTRSVCSQLQNLNWGAPHLQKIGSYNHTFSFLRPFFTNKGSTEILDVPKVSVWVSKEFVMWCYHCFQESSKMSDDSGSRRYDSDSHLVSDVLPMCLYVDGEYMNVHACPMIYFPSYFEYTSVLLHFFLWAIRLQQISVSLDSK